MNSDMVQPEKFGHLHLVYHFAAPLMIELYLHTKIYLDYFPRRLKYAELGKSMNLTFWDPVPKVVEVIQ